MPNTKLYRITNNQWPQVEVSMAETHSILSAHFPSNPIVPGACLLDMVREILSQQLNQPVCEQKIVNLKFLQPVLPATEITVDYQLTAPLKYSIRLFSNQTVYAKMSIQYMCHHSNL